jgi:hypothetical protein
MGVGAAVFGVGNPLLLPPTHRCTGAAGVSSGSPVVVQTESITSQDRNENVSNAEDACQRASHVRMQRRGGGAGQGRVRVPAQEFPHPSPHPTTAEPNTPGASAHSNRWRPGGPTTKTRCDHCATLCCEPPPLQLCSELRAWGSHSLKEVTDEYEAAISSMLSRVAALPVAVGLVRALSTVGKTITCKAAVAFAAKQPLEVVDVQVAPPQAGVGHCARCSWLRRSWAVANRWCCCVCVCVCVLGRGTTRWRTASACA